MKPFDPELLRRVPAARAPVAVLSVAGVVGGAVAVGQAVAVAWLASTVVTGGDLTAPLTWAVVLLAARGVIAGAQESLAGWAGQRVASGIRTQLLRRWSRLPEGSRPDPDEAVQQATDGVASLEPYVARYLPALLAAAVVPGLTVVTLLLVDVWSALIVVVTMPLLPLFAALIGRHTEEETRRRRLAMTDLAGHFLDVVRGLPTLVAYGRADRQVQVVAEVGRRHQRATVRTLRTAFLSTVALELLATISVALVAVCVGLRLAYGAMGLQVAMTAILLAPEAYWPIRRVGAEFHNAADGAEALDRLLPALASHPTERVGASCSTPPSASAPADPPPPSASAPADPPPLSASAPRGITVDGLSYHHPGRSDTLRDLDLASGPGPGLTALTGPSGSGKTTLLELIAGIRTPITGTVRTPRAHLATQRPLLLPGTVRDNLLLDGRAVGDGALRRALGRVGLWEALAARQGLDTRLGDDGFGLSAGQRARLALARAVLSEVSLVLLDEPTAHIAPEDRDALWAVIAELAHHRRVVVATHDPDLLPLADQHWALPFLTEGSGPPPVPTPQTGGGVVPDARGAVTSSPPAPSGASLSDPAGAGAPAAGAAPSLARVAPRVRLHLAAVLGGLATASGVALTATSGWLIVQASYQPVVLTLLVAIVGVRAFGLARPVLRYAERVTSHDVALADLARARTQTYRRLIPLTPARLGRRSRADVLTGVVRDLDDVTDEQVRVVVPTWDTVIASAVAALVVGAFLPVAGAAVATGALLVFLLGRLGQALETPAHRQLVSARGRVRRTATMIGSQLTQVQAVTGLDRADALVARVDAGQAAETLAARRLSRIRGTILAATWLVIAATVGIVAWLAGAAHLSASASASASPQTLSALSGPVAALVTLTPMALAEAWAGLPEVFGARARAAAARGRLAALLSQTPAVAQADPTSPDRADDTDIDHADRPTEGAVPTLTLTAAEARWDAGRGAPDLAATDLTLGPGDRVVLTGPNGVGKSTLLAVLARHLDPSAGTYRHDDHEVRALPLEQVRARLAVVDDEPHAFAGTVRANLVLARPEASDAELVEALVAADLGHWLDRLPHGLDTRLTGLSGGERTRLSLARAILSGRPVLLLDEPTAHLDEATASRVLEGLHRTGRSAVLVSHDVRPHGWRTVRLEQPGRPHPAATRSPGTPVASVVGR